MTMHTILLWASHNFFTLASICFGGATLMVILYTYVHDYVLVRKNH